MDIDVGHEVRLAGNPDREAGGGIVAGCVREPDKDQSPDHAVGCLRICLLLHIAMVHHHMVTLAEMAERVQDKVADHRQGVVVFV